MLALAVAVLASYLLGSIPAAHIAGTLSGVDLRKHGSGNLGATNVIRVLGAKIGIIVFAFDMAKGAVPVLLFPKMVLQSASAASLSGALANPIIIGIICGIAAIAGHVRPIYLRFGKGGKGVATAAGVFVALAPLPTLLTLVIFAVVLMSSGYVSLGSLTSAAMLPILLALSVGVQSPLFPLSIVVAAFVFWTHRANIKRLRNGEEHRFGKRGPVGVGGGKRPVATIAISLVILLSMLAARRFG